MEYLVEYNSKLVLIFFYLVFGTKFPLDIELLHL